MRKFSKKVYGIAICVLILASVSAYFIYVELEWNLFSKPVLLKLVRETKKSEVNIESYSNFSELPYSVVDNELIIYSSIPLKKSEEESETFIGEGVIIKLSMAFPGRPQEEMFVTDILPFLTGEDLIHSAKTSKQREIVALAVGFRSFFIESSIEQSKGKTLADMLDMNYCIENPSTITVLQGKTDVFLSGSIYSKNLDNRRDILIQLQGISIEKLHEIIRNFKFANTKASNEPFKVDLDVLTIPRD